MPLDVGGEMWTVVVSLAKKTFADGTMRRFFLDASEKPGPGLVEATSAKHIALDKFQQLVVALNAQLPLLHAGVTATQAAVSAFKASSYATTDDSTLQFVFYPAAKMGILKTKLSSAPTWLMSKNIQRTFSFGSRTWTIIPQSKKRTHVDFSDAKVYLDLENKPGYSECTEQQLTELCAAINAQLEELRSQTGPAAMQPIQVDGSQADEECIICRVRLGSAPCMQLHSCHHIFHEVAVYST
jgi:hypothetical protein